MNKLLLVLFLPLSVFGQTIHTKDDKIDYTGKVRVPGVSQEILHQRAEAALPDLIRHYQWIKPEKDDSHLLQLRGTTTLTTPYSLIRKVVYTLGVTIEDASYQYHIDSVYLLEQERGGKEKQESSDKLLKHMGESGPPAIATEKILNEIDMNFQKLLTLLQKKMAAKL